MEQQSDVRSIRESAGLKQYEVAAALGVAQSTVARAESGSHHTELTKTLVDLVKELGPEGLRTEYAKRQAPADKKATDTEPAKKPAQRPVPKPAIASEIQAFLKRTDMTPKEFSELAHVPVGLIRGVMQGTILPVVDRVASLRAAMAHYEGTNPGQFTPKVDPAPAAPEKPKLSSTSVDSVGLSIRAIDWLKKSSINSIERLATHSEDDLRRLFKKLPNRPKAKVMGEIKTMLAERGLALAGIPRQPDDAPPPPFEDIYIAKSTAKTLEANGIKKMADLCKWSKEKFQTRFGVSDKDIRRLSGGLRARGWKWGKGAPVEHVAPKVEAPKVEAPKTEAPKAAPVAPQTTLAYRDGVFLANGTNVAPHLVLDGKTLHVFTLTPGGVFLSYMNAEIK